MTAVKITFSREVSLEEIENLLTTAFEGGIGYWCQIRGYSHRPAMGNTPLYKGGVEPRYISYAMTPGGAVLLQDYTGEIDDTFPHGTKWKLTFAKIKKGLQVMAKEQPKHFANFVNEIS